MEVWSRVKEKGWEGRFIFSSIDAGMGRHVGQRIVLCLEVCRSLSRGLLRWYGRFW